jgi:parallel beta-helix repeat protein
MTTLIPKFDLKNGGATPTGASNRTIYQKLSDFVSIKDFGAIGDGTTDDTTAITNAAAYSASSGSAIYLPVGTYLFKDDLDFTDVSFIGESKFSSILMAGTKPSPSTYGCFSLTVQGDVTLQNFTYKNQTWTSGTGTGGSTGLSILAATNFFVDNLIVENMDGWALTPQNSTGGTVSNCIVRNTNSDGIHLTGCQNVSVVGNVVYNTRDDCISLTSEDAGILATYQDQFGISVVGNTINSSSQGRGIALDGGYNYTVSANTINHAGANGQAGIGVACATAYTTRPTYSIVIDGNTIQQPNGFSGSAQQGIWLTGGVRDITISNNILTRVGTGILLDQRDNSVSPNQNINILNNTFTNITTSISTSGNNDAVYHLTINNNTFEDGTDTQIYLGSGTVNLSIVGNRFSVLPVNNFVYQILIDANTGDTIVFDSNLINSGNAYPTRASFNAPNIVIGENYVDQLDLDNAAWRNKNNGTFTGNGTGSATQFTVLHRLGGTVGRTPTNFNIAPSSSACALPYYVTADSTTLYINFATAPASGTNNVVFDWYVHA